MQSESLCGLLATANKENDTQVCRSHRFQTQAQNDMFAIPGLGDTMKYRYLNRFGLDFSGGSLLELNLNELCVSAVFIVIGFTCPALLLSHDRG